MVSGLAAIRVYEGLSLVPEHFLVSARLFWHEEGPAGFRPTDNLPPPGPGVVTEVREPPPSVLESVATTRIRSAAHGWRDGLDS